ncbi:MAG TPA: 4-hydroxy-tetrahydrodipicolinate synthase [Polyangiales bacterium]|nr:4-hydroxy-tetrahydrodipicolinate synthase [Polyangiales bacterium]
MGTFEGAWTALVTPFRDDAIDERALRDLVEGQIAGGIDGLMPCGTTGESVNLDDAEFAQLLRIVIDQVKGRIPVVPGVGTASTRHTLALCAEAKKLRADGVLVVTPYYSRPTQDGLYAHFRAIVERGGLPVVLYNIPGRCGVDISLPTMERLAGFQSIVAIKEATGNVSRSMDLIAQFGSRFTVLSGDDALTLPIMAVGGRGVVSVASNVVPAEVSKLVDLALAGSWDDARAQALRLRPLFDVLFIEASPGPAKAAMVMQRRIAPEIRLPMVMPGDAAQTKLRSVLAKLGAL